MRSVADGLREASTARVLGLPVSERISLALALGDDDLDVFVRASGLTRDEALARLRAARQHARRPSVAGAPRP